MDIKNIIKSYEDEVIALRREIHQNPEVGFEEIETSQKVYDYLKDCKLEVNKICKTGVVGLLKGEHPGKTILLRADIDALEVKEEVDVDYKSKNIGKMHACGHDAHTAMLLVAAKILSENKDKIHGNVKFLFQPNEEGSSSLLTIEEGILENPKVDAASATHIWTQLESGKIGISNGAVMAALEEFKIVIKGRGGHTGSPHTAIDPIMTAVQIIQSSQQIQTRRLDPREPTVIMFGKVESGKACNVIPETATLEGTMRFLYKEEDEGKEILKMHFEKIIKGICLMTDTEYEINYYNSSPAVINDSTMVSVARKSAKETLDDENNLVEYSYIAGEDFSEFSKRVPSVFYFLGTGNKEKQTDYPHHHPKFNIDEDNLITGVEMHVRNVLEFLK